MSQVSNYPVPASVADRIFSIFIKSLVSVKNKKEAQKLIEDLFSPAERIMLSKRLSIAFLLMRGYEYRQISRLLRVSLTTVASVNGQLRYGQGGYREILNKISKEEKLEDFFSKVLEEIVSVPASGGKGSGTWKYLRDELRKGRRKHAF